MGSQEEFWFQLHISFWRKSIQLHFTSKKYTSGLRFGPPISKYQIILAKWGICALLLKEDFVLCLSLSSFVILERDEEKTVGIHFFLQTGMSAQTGIVVGEECAQMQQGYWKRDVWSCWRSTKWKKDMNKEYVKGHRN